MKNIAFLAIIAAVVYYFYSKNKDQKIPLKDGKYFARCQWYELTILGAVGPSKNLIKFADGKTVRGKGIIAAKIPFQDKMLLMSEITIFDGKVVYQTPPQEPT